jgi:hypothetical protein
MSTTGLRSGQPDTQMIQPDHQRSARIRSAAFDFFSLFAITAVGFAFDWFSAVLPAELPFWAPWEFSWTAFLGTGCALLWYVQGLVRTLPLARPLVWRRLAFFAGVLSIYAVWQTRFQFMAEHMFFLCRIQHMVMHHLGPMLGFKSAPSARRYCRGHDELRNFLRSRSRMCQHVPPAARRFRHRRRTAIVLGILEAA